MASNELYDLILQYVTTGNWAEAFSCLLDYANINNADDKTINNIIKFISGTTGTYEPEEMKIKIVDLLNSINPNTKANPVENDSDVVKLSRDNFFNQTINPVFSCANISKKLGAFALQNISIDLRVGQITGVVGENGNGKTTLCRIVAGLLSKDEGNLSYPYLTEGNSKKPTWEIIKSYIAYLPQELPSLSGTVRNTLHLEASLHGIKGDANTQRVEFIIRSLGLVNYADKEWNQLSGGYKLRFALAKVLIWRPRLIVLDEPLANLDLKAQITVLTDLRDFADSINYPMSILVTSQHIHEIEFIADKIIFLKDGKITYYDTIDRIGEDRLINNYELYCKHTAPELKDALNKLGAIKIFSNGLYYEIESPIGLGSNSILKALNESNIEVLYFRNISNSTKKFLFANS
ncbi:MAG TPA: ABC transporter ATP-binding protein [Puia sp.]|jgi:ABC-type multidrug transport system ATPase subunit|nr:ABC transporter ATP-binding protein [Puia sp.]